MIIASCQGFCANLGAKNEAERMITMIAMIARRNENRSEKQSENRCENGRKVNNSFDRGLRAWYDWSRLQAKNHGPIEGGDADGTD